MADRIVQLEDNNGDKIYPVSVLPDGQAYIEVTSTDPGEGVSLEADHFIAVTGQSGLLDLFYPVGSYYETSDTSFNPNTAWGGTWVEDTAGRVLVAQDSGTFATVGNTGGEEKSSQLNCGDAQYGLTGTGPAYADRTIVRTPHISSSHGEIPAQISLLQPYVVVKRWHRTA